MSTKRRQSEVEDLRSKRQNLLTKLHAYRDAEETKSETVPCQVCRGRGWVFGIEGCSNSNTPIRCTYCRGTGKVTTVKTEVKRHKPAPAMPRPKKYSNR